MAIIRVLSWNIESLGDAKATVVSPAGVVGESELINLINLMVREAEADVVGIMEVKSGRGASILGWLLPRLNNGAAPGAQWQGRVSARQDGGTQEEVLYLWQQQANFLVLDLAGQPAPISSVGIVDQNALQLTFAALGIANNAPAQDAFLTALHTAGYTGHGTYAGRGKKRPLTQTWRMNSDQWHALSTAPPPATVNFGAAPLPVPPPTAAELQALAATLIGTDILRFVSYGDRSPFLANFQIGNPAKRVMVGILHAPGPQDRLLPDAVNVAGLSSCAAAADNLVLMGDFNIAANKAGTLAVEYGRFDRNGSFVFAQLVPKAYQQVFDPIENAPLNADNQVLAPDPRTTVINTYLQDGAPLNSVLANTFDKFFFRGNANAAQAVTCEMPQVWNMVEHLDPGEAEFRQVVAQSAMAFFRAFRGDAYLAKADASMLKNYNKYQRAFTLASNAAARIQAKIAATGAPLSSQLFTRLSKQNVKATAASQQMASLGFQRAAIAALRTLVGGAGTEPTGSGTALAIYREAISDHFPISLDLRT